MYGQQGLTDILLVPQYEEEQNGWSNIPNALRSQWSSEIERRFLFTKLILGVGGLALMVVSTLINLVHRNTRSTACIEDFFQNWTNSINAYLVDHDASRDALIAFASFLIDFNALVLCIRWLWNGRSLRLMFTIIVFYIFRGVIQIIFSETYPEHYIFSYPGFPSMTVPYAPANDFFFSGHVGITTICFLEVWRDKAKPFYIIAFITIFIEFFTLLVTRKHHFIDMPVGLMTAHYVYRFGLWLDDYFKNSDCCAFKYLNSRSTSIASQRQVSVSLESSQHSFKKEDS